MEPVTGTLVTLEKAVLGAEQGQNPDQRARSEWDVGAEAAGARTTSDEQSGTEAGTR